MALVVFLRAVNVGGHNTFRPSVLANELSEYDVVNIGAAGTFVVRKAVSQKKFRRELLNRLEFPTEVMICEGRVLASVAADDPFASEPSRPDVVRFVSVLSKTLAGLPVIPRKFPTNGEWVLRITGGRRSILVRCLQTADGGNRLSRPGGETPRYSVYDAQLEYDNRNRQGSGRRLTPRSPSP